MTLLNLAELDFDETIQNVIICNVIVMFLIFFKSPELAGIRDPK